MAADVSLGYDQPGVTDRGRLVDMVVVDVISVCQRRGQRLDPTVVRELVEHEWAGYADAPVQKYLPVLIGRAVSGYLLREASDPTEMPPTGSNSQHPDRSRPPASV